MTTFETQTPEQILDEMGGYSSYQEYLDEMAYKEMMAADCYPQASEIAEAAEEYRDFNESREF